MDVFLANPTSIICIQPFVVSFELASLYCMKLCTNSTVLNGSLQVFKYSSNQDLCSLQKHRVIRYKGESLVDNTYF